MIGQGRATVEEVPAPCVEPGAVLIRLSHSCISPGTELAGVRASGEPLWKRALRQPGKVAKVARMVVQEGVSRTRDAVEARLGGRSVAGYSAAGVVMEVGAGVDDVRPGDRVACAGAQCAFHAEIVSVPRNLVVPVPGALGLADAATVTLGAIALQGVRRARPTLGEVFVVLGLGIIGQLTAQILKANGCRVIGADPDGGRLDLARKLGLDMTLESGGEPARSAEEVARMTGGLGADGVIIAASGASDEIASTAFQMCRKKGRVVLVGDVGLNLRRADFYQKEIDFLISTSYGPGRYDPRYEEQGLDYPVAYVRWTENRNMAEYLRLVESGKVVLEPLLSGAYAIDDAAAAYRALEGGDERPLAALLEYPGTDTGAPARIIANPRAKARTGPGRDGAVGLAVVGAGAFATAVHLPNLRALESRFRLHAVVGRQGHAAKEAASRFGAAVAATDYDAVLEAPEVDAVLIATRHHLHGEMVLKALAAGKHVLVEKPLALSSQELARIREFYESADEDAPVLLTGFNRRFSSHARRIKELTAGREHPMILNYQMNAGYLAPDHWVHGPQGGGRNLGEACHIYDLFGYLTNSAIGHVDARAISGGGTYGGNDNFVATLSFEDGSLATLTYTSLGAADHPKEQLTVYSDGRVISLGDYRTLEVRGAGSRNRGFSTSVPDKGHAQELEAFADGIRTGEFPIPLWQQLQATEIALEVERLIAGETTASAG